MLWPPFPPDGCYSGTITTVVEGALVHVEETSVAVSEMHELGASLGQPLGVLLMLGHCISKGMASVAPRFHRASSKSCAGLGACRDGSCLGCDGLLLAHLLGVWCRWGFMPIQRTFLNVSFELDQMFFTYMHNYFLLFVIYISSVCKTSISRNNACTEDSCVSFSG